MKGIGFRNMNDSVFETFMTSPSHIRTLYLKLSGITERFTYLVATLSVFFEKVVSTQMPFLFRLNLFPRAIVVPCEIAGISQPLKGFQYLFGWIDEFVFA